MLVYMLSKLNGIPHKHKSMGSRMPCSYSTSPLQPWHRAEAKDLVARQEAASRRLVERWLRILVERGGHRPTSTSPDQVTWGGLRGSASDQWVQPLCPARPKNPSPHVDLSSEQENEVCPDRQVVCNRFFADINKSLSISCQKP